MYELLAILLGFVGLLVTQAGLHRRGMREQDTKRDEMLATLAQERAAEAERLARERREEQRELIDRMAEQSNRVVEGALEVAEVHKSDAETARLLAIENARNHAECRQEVAHLGGKVEELRARVIETERTSGRDSAVSQWHQDVKHMAVTALAASEGITGLAVSCAKKCNCHAFDPMSDLLEGYTPRLEAIVEENKRLFTSGEAVGAAAQTTLPATTTQEDP